MVKGPANQFSAVKSSYNRKSNDNFFWQNLGQGRRYVVVRSIVECHPLATVVPFHVQPPLCRYSYSRRLYNRNFDKRRRGVEIDLATQNVT